MGNSTLAATQYGTFRTDKPALPGHSAELVYVLVFDLLSRCITNKDKPDYLAPAEYQGCKTILQMFDKTVKRCPANRFLGTRDESEPGRPYKWKNFKQVYDLMEVFARGKPFFVSDNVSRDDTVKFVPTDGRRGVDVEVHGHIRQE